jgi:hypothetical protein
MQTFLPYNDFVETANCLDYRRLGKQRVECVQIITTLVNNYGGWLKHPAVKMWTNNIECLKLYTNICIDEWIKRGYKNTMRKFVVDEQSISYPSWFGDEEFHNSHKSNLLRKDELFYSKYNWEVSNNLPYKWPV